MRLSLSSLALGCGLLWMATAQAVPSHRPGTSAPLAPPAAGLVDELSRKLAVEGLKWAPDWGAAQRVAARENLPVLAYFYSPLCNWCARMDEETLASPEVRRRLAGFVLVKVNILEDEKMAARFRIRATPSLVFLNPEGRESGRLDGFTQSERLVGVLDGISANRVQSQDQRLQTLLAQVRQGKLADEDWAELVVALGSERYRAPTEQAILALRPLPRVALVRLLEHALLTVRLGALEVLEEMAGDDFGFNPWRDVPADNEEALGKWRQWTTATSLDDAGQPAFFRVLSAAQIGDLLQDLIGDDTDRAARARRLLRKDPDSCLEGIAAFAAAHPALPAGSGKRLRELRYALQLPVVNGLDPASVAHRLVFGNMDVRLKALRDVAMARQRAVPVIAEFLGDPDSLVRETAVDALVTTGGREAVGLLEALLQKETDANVVYVVLRQLGNLRSKKGLGILLRYLADPNEDFVIVALESIAKLRVESVGEAIQGCLADRRWRVRTAALKTAEALTLRSLAPTVVALLDDPDEFVRSSAVATLAKLGVGDALPKLESIFASDDALKGPIVKALLAADMPIPATMLKVLAERPASVKLAVLDNVESVDAKVAPLVIAFASNADSDLACASLRLLAGKGLALAACQATVAQQVQTGDRRRLLSLMDAVVVETKMLLRYNPAAQRIGFETAPPNAAPVASDPLAEVFAAFEPAPSGNGTASVEEVFAAFGEATGTAESFVDVLRRIGQRTLAVPGDSELRAAAARMLVRLGDTAGASVCSEGLPGLDEGRRMELAQGLERVRQRDGLPLIRGLLADPSAEVREAASASLMEDGADEACLRVLLEELEKPGARLQAPEVLPVLQSAGAKKAVRAAVLGAAHRWLQGPQSERLRLLALMLLSKVWSSESERLVEPFLTVDNPWQRRAAFYALGRGNLPRFMAEAGRMAADTADCVREVLPYLSLPAGTDGGRFTYYFGERIQAREGGGYSGRAGSRGAVAPLPEGAVQALRILARDPSERVRFLALFGLIARQQPVELGDVVRSLERMPRDSELLEQFSSYVLQQYASLGREFAVVLPYLNWERNYRGEETALLIRRHFGVPEDDGAAESPVVRTVRAPLRAVASYVAPVAQAEPAVAVRPENYRLVYFTKPGCKECAVTTRKLEQLREAFPEVSIVEYDINKTSSVLLNEALGERFGVPAGVRLVAPAVFCGGGYLIKGDISVDRLGPMLARAANVPLADWLTVPAEGLAGAHAEVAQRFEATGLGVVLFAGLLDGVNPCAFATIIFLLSYLQLSRRSPAAMAQIGLAYVAGVFLAYFTIGLGLAKVAAMVAQVRWTGPLLSYAMAGFALVIMALNIRDGVRCRRGELAEMTLQLPAFLKKVIHWLIRHGVRQGHFVLVSFFLGVAISVLELACTGQVYLPTITYMIQQGEARALGSLLAYNLAFIAPLVVVFVLTIRGLRSETLVKLLKRRAAWVKFATAGCFLLLALFLVFGPQFLG